LWMLTIKKARRRISLIELFFRLVAVFRSLFFSFNCMIELSGLKAKRLLLHNPFGVQVYAFTRTTELSSE